MSQHFSNISPAIAYSHSAAADVGYLVLSGLKLKFVQVKPTQKLMK